MSEDVTPLVVADLAGADGAALLALNNAHAVELSWLEPGRLAHLVAEAFAARRVGTADALLLTFDQAADYDSVNFLWFRARYPTFADDLDAALHRARVRMAENLGVPERVEEIDVLAHLTRAALYGLAMESTFVGRSTDDALKVVALLKSIRQRLIDELKPAAA